ncbi:MAG: tetratricopeptide repeat protein [Candidatus Thermoplasmatota archaeon]|jgi:Flp pilus assembly protein TadD|nr:tetratricopeptide repeat protein [Candidatus Thermoplasmatota archaeon]
MSLKENSKALGRGLKALIRERAPSDDKSEGLTEAEAKAQNMEFYGSLMKQYVQVGEGDRNTEELLYRIRQHLDIDEDEHEHLVHTLRKRDTIDPNVSQEELHKAQKEMKQELKQLFMEFKDGELPTEANGTMADAVEHRSGPGGTPIPLPERTSELIKGQDAPISVPPAERSSSDQQTMVRKRVRRLIVPKDLDERAGIIQEGGGYKRGRVDWIDDGRDMSIPMPPSRNDPVKEREVEGPVADLKSDVPSEGGDMFEDLGEVPESGPPVHAINVVKGSEVLREMLDEEGISAVRPLVKGELRAEVDRAVVGGTRKDTSEIEDSMMSLRQLMDEERFEEALDMSERLLSKGPGSTSVLNEKGFILFHLGRVNEALETYRDLLSKDPGSVEAMVNYAQVLSSMGKLDESLEYLDLAVKKDPYSEDAWNNKAVVLSRFGRLREALVCLDEAMRINDRSIVSLMNTGVILERMGEYGPATEAYKGILDIEPGNEMAKQGYESCCGQIR